MHYRDGTPAELGDKVTIADQDSLSVEGEKMPDHMASEQYRKMFTGTVVGRDTGGTCGVAIFQPTGNVPRFLGNSVICTQSQLGQLYALEGKCITIEPKYMKKLA